LFERTIRLHHGQPIVLKPPKWILRMHGDDPWSESAKRFSQDQRNLFKLSKPRQPLLKGSDTQEQIEWLMRGPLVPFFVH